MNTNHENSPLGNAGMEERLWNYIDGISSREEQTAIGKLLNDDSAWKAKYQALLEIHQMIQVSGLEEPSLRFSKKVMEEIARIHVAPAAKTYSNKKIRAIGFFFIALVAGILIYSISQIDWSAPNSTTDKYISQIDFSGIFSNTWVNVFMMINVVLGLFLFDNYLGSKRKKFRTEEQGMQNR